MKFFGRRKLQTSNSKHQTPAPNAFGVQKLQAPMPDVQVLAALSVMEADNPQWRAVHEILERQIRIEMDSLLVPDLTDSAAQFNRGRVASLESLKDTLHQIWVKSRELEQS